MRLSVFVAVYLSGLHAEAFPGKRLFGKLKDEIQQKTSRGKKHASKSAESCDSCENSQQPDGDYPPGALPLLKAATEAFTEAFGTTPTLAAQAPGRVNLIGEHTDYTGGFVLPLALEKRTVVVFTGGVVDSNAGECAVVSVGMEGGPVTFDAKPEALAPGDPFWANYVKGVVKQYSADLPPGKKFAFKAAFASDVPLGAGLSSSAALEVATATMLEQLHPPGGSSVSKETKALRCQAAEHEFCGMPCGIMDQFISALGEQGKLLQIDCRSNKGTAVTMGAGDAVILVTNSNVKHTLSGSEYPTRVAQCKAATQAIAKLHPEVTQLRDATPVMLEGSAKSAMDDETYRRARHVIYENLRVVSAVEALERGKFEAVGRAMLASHTSLRDDFEVSCLELDTLVDLASGFEGVYGARMTGGGFGGCIVTLVKAASAPGLIAHLEEKYKKATGLNADSFITRPGVGAGPLKPL
eukprot:CAMPEP_0172585050 /NCGR_PEP_ID=MMETSP1068-20121228/4531_1 /TAXON_ID=35684 /ORGANISM="Pseudopedinella elastica, Strain CCMP716" /LENGTH=467 /DNA_ID=CAMNT_0013379387 /DNA_START=225 /DNA_END=1628 /DNA_ORIENTATION=+